MDEGTGGGTYVPSVYGLSPGDLAMSKETSQHEQLDGCVSQMSLFKFFGSLCER